MFILNNPLTSISTENFIATFDCQVTIYHRGLHGIHGIFMPNHGIYHGNIMDM